MCRLCWLVGEIMSQDYGTPYVDENYTGPYLSNGKYQSSVEFGDAEPNSRLDALSRLHDSAYAHFEDRNHREAADRIYNKEAKELASQFPQLAGEIVEYGNFASNSFSTLIEDTSTGFKYGGPFGALLGLVYGGVENLLHLNDTLNHGKEYEKDVLDYYASDPQKGNPRYYPGVANIVNIKNIENKNKNNNNQTSDPLLVDSQYSRPFNYRRRRKSRKSCGLCL